MRFLGTLPSIFGAAVLAACSLASMPPPLAAEETYAEPIDGFLARDGMVLSPEGVGVGGMTVSREGNLILYANGVLMIREPEGDRTLASFDPPVFGSFLVLSPDGESVYFGESSEWYIYRVPLHGGAAQKVDQLHWSYDLAFDSAGRGFISALRNNPENEIVLLDDDPAVYNSPVITNIAGWSGTLTFDGEGNLYYATADLSGDPIRQSLHRYSRAQIEAAVAGEVIDFSTDPGTILLEGMDGFYNLRWFEGRLYFTDLGFISGAGSIQTLDPQLNYLPETLATFAKTLDPESALVSPTYFCFRGGARAFAAGNGPAGGTLLVSYSIYKQVLRVAEITPELHFIRADLNGDDSVDISDAVALLNYLFLGATAPEPIVAADADADGELVLTDAIYILEFLFNGGPTIPPPYPERGPGQ